ncbi:MAG: trimethylamine methyltransferase family protein [Spirochaetota bacterium]|nr:MAG: trimethylamine methyltransferase family protein [Spirochaetota bacterium]
MKIELLNNEQIRMIHTNSIRILETIGVQIPHEEVLELFRGEHAEVDKDKQIVKIPEKLINHSLEVCGKQFTIYGRDRSQKGEFGVGKRNYHTVEGEPLWVDDNLQRRYTTLEDIGAAARLGDALPRLNIVGAMSDAHEIPIDYRYVVIFAELFKHTTKPIMNFFHNRPTTRFILDLFTIIAGTKEEAIKYPFTFPFFEPISPLRYPRDGVDLLFETCRYNLPVQIGPIVQAGATGPVTLAGTMVQENAEILAGNCIVQIINPGNPIIYGALQTIFDMGTTQMVLGGPEQALMAVGMTQMGKHYNLPVYVNVGFTDSKIMDAQAGLEAGINLACGMMARADKYGVMGTYGGDQGGSLLMLMMQHELIGFIDRMIEGVEISDEKIGLEIIKHAKETGTFLTEKHTLKHFRKELWFPELLDRNCWEVWVDKGKKDMMSRCKEMKDKLLKEHEPEPLADDMQKEIDKLLHDAKKHLSK